MTKKPLVEMLYKRKAFKTETYYLDYDIKIAYGYGVFVVEMLGCTAVTAFESCFVF